MKPLFALFLAACGTSTPTPDAPVTTTDAMPVVEEPAPVAATTPAAAPAATAAAAPTVSDLGQMSKAQLRIARNEVFARHGRAFSSADLQTHFAGQSWYQVNADYSDAMLSDGDKANVALIASFETDRNPVEHFQFSGEPTLSFADAHTVVIGDFAAIYEGSAPTFSYSTHGDWVLTWDGPYPMAAGASNLAWYELDYDTEGVKRRVLPADRTH
jgi:hypothetical protein